MKKFALFFCVLLLLFSPASLFAQKDSAASTTSYWQADITYLSNNVYLGRKDSLRLPYLTPSLTYFHKSGLYVSGGVSYLAASGSSRIDLSYIDAGYSFSLNNFEGQVSATKYFYSSQSTNVNADVKAGLDLYAAYDFGSIKPSAEATLNIGKLTDYILTLGLEHSFDAGDGFEITPSVFMNAGTQNAYNSYYNQRRFAVRKKKARTRNPVSEINASVQNAAAFKILDYEASVPVSYKLQHFTFNVTPAVALPVHPAVIQYTVKNGAGNSRSATYTESLQNCFYWSAGITYTF